MENNLSIREILEWYVTAGVDETFGEVPFGLEAPKPKAEPAPRPVLTTRAEDSVAPRAATTDLAQATISACKNARELCAEAQTLEELREMVEKFEGCALKLTANKTVFGGGNPNSKNYAGGRSSRGGRGQNRTAVCRPQRAAFGQDAESGQR